MRSIASGVDLLVITLLAGIAIFYRLGDLPIYLWDESRLANNAIEMLTASNWLVTTYDGEPDLWNTKPPLQIWLMAGSMWLFGASEYALRLPSALAAFATTLVVYGFASRETGSRFAGLAAAVILLGTVGFVAPHVARTSDYDSLLILTTTLSALAFYRLVEEVRASGRAAPRWLVLFVLATATGVFVKGVAGLLFLPGFALYAVARGALHRLLLQRAGWVALASLIALPAAFYILREWVEPGYLAAVQDNELGGRFLETLEGHDHGAWFYVNQLTQYWWPGSVRLYILSAAPWVWFVPLALVAGLFSRHHRECTAFLGLIILVYLVIISSAQTKLQWYVAPVFPLIAVLLALGGHAGLQRLIALIPLKGRRLVSGAAFATVMLVGLVVMAAVSIRNVRIIEAAPRITNLQSAAFLRNIATGPADGAVRILHDGYEIGADYSPQEEFYAKRLRLWGVDAEVVPSDTPLTQGDLAIWCDSHVTSIPQVTGTILAEQEPCRLVRVHEGAP